MTECSEIIRTGLPILIDLDRQVPIVVDSKCTHTKMLAVPIPYRSAI